MSNLLAFSLGLNSNQFLGGIKGAGSALSAFIGLGAPLHGILTQIERGADLFHLSKRTGESVASLYSLQRGLKAVGLAGNDGSVLIQQMNRALGGFNEMGEPTKDIFAGLGLSVEQLKRGGGVEAVVKITDALSRLNRTEATAAAAKIFGRGGAGDALQIARSQEEFAEALHKSAEGAKLFGANARAFADIERSIGRLKATGSNFFAGIAAGAAPALRDLLAILNNVDLSGLGRNLGRLLSAFAEAIKQQRLGEILEATLTLAFEKSVNAFASALRAVFAALPSLVSALAVRISGIISAALGDLYSILGKNGLADAFKANAFDAVFTPAKLWNKAFADAFAANKVDLFNVGDTEQRLKRLVEELQPARVVADAVEGGEGLLPGEAKSKRERRDRGNASAFERIGAIFGSGSNADHARQTAIHTQNSARSLVQLVGLQQQLVKRLTGFDFANR